MQDKDHKISREIIDFAIDNHISVIRLEQLTNIRQTARTSRKNEKICTLGHSIVCHDLLRIKQC